MASTDDDDNRIQQMEGAPSREDLGSCVDRDTPMDESTHVAHPTAASTMTMDETLQDIQDQMQQPNIKRKSSKDTNTPTGTTVYAETVERLDLIPFFPGKLSIRDVQAEWWRKGDSAKDLPWVILRQTLMGDYRARDDPVQRYNTKLKQATDASKPQQRPRGISRRGVKQSASTLKTLHPSDVLLTIIACCDGLLRQALYEKLVMCRLSVPFVVPRGKGGSEFMLWALKRIILSWKENIKIGNVEGAQNSSEKTFEVPADSAQIPIISFLRMGDIPLSKSIMINSVLGSKNNTFFTKECPGGRLSKTINDGAIDMTWHLPTKTSIPKPYVYLNLRGDAECHQKHVDVLLNISDMIAIVTTTDNFSKTKDRFELFATSGKYVIVIVLLGNADIVDPILDQLDKFADKYKDKSAIIYGFDFNRDKDEYEKKNLDEIKSEIIQEIAQRDVDSNVECIMLSERIQQLNVLNLASINVGEKTGDLNQEFKRIRMDSSDSSHCVYESSSSSCSVIDEFSSGCVSSFQLFNNLHDVVKQLSVKEMKETLSLQGPKYAEWVEQFKIESKPGFKRSNPLTLKERDDIYVHKHQLRKEQVDMYQVGGQLMKTFIKCLIESHSDEVQGTFIQYLKLYLDSMSRKYIPDISLKYSTLWGKLRKCKSETTKSQLQQDLDRTGKDLVNASLGLEHIYREMAQIYEAFRSCQVQSSIPDLPKLMASQILKGHPFEVMNGDVSCVPILWLKAVFDELKLILRDKKLCVLSVLGVQSSGKSTLLNAMFGLEFAVSAGRCTRGIFAQLIEMSHPNCPFDYLLVVDTEGLRAPELRDFYYDHDNELATLILGFGDITIINLKGENTAEIKDVLQIAVHAFLKLKVANKCKDLYQHCVFIHQNVSSVTAHSKMAHAQQQLQDTLDEMAREAAKLENIHNINSFNDVIKFNGKDDILMFPDLWEGEPPMAAVNPGYVDKASETYQKIIHGMACKRTSFYSVDEIFHRINDLWEGISSMDFVFNFRNTLELKAYDNLETKYRELLWDAEQSTMTWYTDNAKPAINKCGTEDEIEDQYNVLSVQLNEDVASKKQSIKTALTSFIQEHHNKDIMKDFEGSKQRCLDHDMNDVLNHTMAQLKDEKSSQAVDIVAGNEESIFVKQLMENAEKVATERRDAKPDDLKPIFDDFWETNTRDLPKGTGAANESIDLMFFEALNRLFQSDQHLLHQQLRLIPLSASKVTKPSEIFDLNKDCHISIKTNIFKKLGQRLGFSPERQVFQQIRDDVMSYLEKMESFINTQLQKNKSITRQHVNASVQKFEEEFLLLTQKCKTCTFPAPGKIYLAVLFSQYATYTFNIHQRKYESEHGIKARLQNWKERCQTIFNNTIERKRDELGSVEYLVNVLKNSIENAALSKVSIKTIDTMLKHFCHQKYHLITSILDELGTRAMRNENCFNDIKRYIRHTQQYAKEWLESYTNNHLFTAESDKSKYATFAIDELTDLIKDIKRSASLSTQAQMRKDKQHQVFADWIADFKSHMPDKIVLKDDLAYLTRKHVSDFKYLEKYFYEKLIEVENEVMNKFKRMTKYSFTWVGDAPYTRIFEKLWGCTAECPFCNEPCHHDNPRHYDGGSSSGQPHRALQHKPKGLNGNHWITSKKLVIENCSYSVSTDYITFQHHQEWIKYRDYKKVHPSWDIPANSGPCSAEFWQWIFYKYHDEFSKAYGREKAEIPSSWKYIKPSGAKDSLRKMYHT